MFGHLGAIKCLNLSPHCIEASQQRPPEHGDIHKATTYYLKLALRDHILRTKFQGGCWVLQELALPGISYPFHSIYSSSLNFCHRLALHWLLDVPRHSPCLILFTERQNWDSYGTCLCYHLRGLHFLQIIVVQIYSPRGWSYRKLLVLPQFLAGVIYMLTRWFDSCTPLYQNTVHMLSQWHGIQKSHGQYLSCKIDLPTLKVIWETMFWDHLVEGQVLMPASWHWHNIEETANVLTGHQKAFRRLKKERRHGTPGG